METFDQTNDSQRVRCPVVFRNLQSATLSQGSFDTSSPPAEGNLERRRDGPAGGLVRLLQGHHDEALEPQVRLDVLGHDGDLLDVPGAQVSSNRSEK